MGLAEFFEEIEGLLGGLGRAGGVGRGGGGGTKGLQVEGEGGARGGVFARWRSC